MWANPIHVQALGNKDSSAMDSAPDNGNPVGHAPLEEAESFKGVNLIDTPIHTPPRNKSPSHFLCHRGWAMGRGRGMKREGAEKSTVVGLRVQSFLFKVFLSLSVLLFACCLNCARSRNNLWIRFMVLNFTVKHRLNWGIEMTLSFCFLLWKSIDPFSTQNLLWAQRNRV